MMPYIEPNLSARTLNRQQASLTERAGKLSLPVNQSVKGKGPDPKTLFAFTPQEKHEMECLFEWQRLSAKSHYILGPRQRKS
jgi:hypothetical protein